ncbi:hypothetical protein [Myxosarcina sp. GI1]|uniref:hypothetical protein n=1 Tax=Myxosarcina sp. GI1 TaxID=1541065 RepID=UPI00055BC41B|nr:hypothetical protein [Myxosarcina sp. GI1]
MTDSYYNFSLKLDKIEYLFKDPEFDLFRPQTESSSGIERIVNQLKPTSLTEKVRTTILLPNHQLSENLEKSVVNALQHYCNNKIENISNDITSLRGRGIRALQRGLLFLAVCLVISTLFDKIEYLPILVHRFLNEGFLIAGWVGLWYPIELLLYEWGPLKRQKQIYEMIKDMEIKITTHS